MGELLNDLIHPELNFKNGFYIEAGANNGIRQSNTLFLEKSLGWSGILVEPNHKKMKLCKEYRGSNNLFYTCALSPSEDVTCITGNFNEDCAGESLMACSQNIIDLDYYDEEFKNQIRDKINSREQISVPAKTLNSILEENKITHVDFMSLDIEGYELEILRNFNFVNFNITFILIETANREKYKKEVNTFLKKFGYELIQQVSNNDELYKKVIK